MSGKGDRLPYPLEKAVRDAAEIAGMNRYQYEILVFGQVLLKAYGALIETPEREAIERMVEKLALAAVNAPVLSVGLQIPLDQR